MAPIPHPLSPAPGAPTASLRSGRSPEQTWQEIRERVGQEAAEAVTYDYVVGAKDAPVNRTGRGTGARRLPYRPRKIREEFNGEALEAEGSGEAPLLDATLPAARLYAEKAAEYEQLVKKARAERLANADQHPSSQRPAGGAAGLNLGYLRPC